MREFFTNPITLEYIAIGYVMIFSGIFLALLYRINKRLDRLISIVMSEFNSF